MTWEIEFNCVLNMRVNFIKSKTAIRIYLLGASKQSAGSHRLLQRFESIVQGGSLRFNIARDVLDNDAFRVREVHGGNAMFHQFVGELAQFDEVRCEFQGSLLIGIGVDEPGSKLAEFRCPCDRRVEKIHLHLRGGAR